MPTKNKKVENAISEIVAETYDWATQDIGKRCLVILAQSAAVIPLWNYGVIDIFPLPRLDYLHALLLVLALKMLFPTHRTDITPALSEEEMELLKQHLPAESDPPEGGGETPFRVIQGDKK